MDHVHAMMIGIYASKLNNLKEWRPGDEDEFYRLNDPTDFRPTPAVTIMVALGLSLTILAGLFI